MWTTGVQGFDPSPYKYHGSFTIQRVFFATDCCPHPRLADGLWRAVATRPVAGAGAEAGRAEFAMAIEIVSFPMNSMVIFHSYVNVYQRVIWWLSTIVTNGLIS